MLRLIKSRITSNKADGNSASQLLWIVLIIVTVLAVGAIIMGALESTADKVRMCMEDSWNLFQGGNHCQ